MSCIRPWVRAGALATLLCLAAAAEARPPRPHDDAAAASAAQRDHLLDQAAAEAQRGHLDAAFLLAQRAAAGEPDTSTFAAAREMLRLRATRAHLDQAHQLQRSQNPSGAAVEYRTALALSPGNVDARAGLAAVMPTAAPPPKASTELRVHNAAPPVQLQPQPGTQAFHLHMGLREAIAQVAAAYGVRAFVAEAVASSPVRLDMGEANFAEAMAGLRAVGGVDWIPLDAHTIYIGGASQMQRVQPVAVRTFYLPWVSDGIALNDIANVVKNLLGVPRAGVDVANRSLSVRATPAQLDATEQLLLDMRHTQGQVVLEVRILEVNSTLARNLGLGQPDHFTMFALGPLLAQLQATASQQQDIFNLFEQGGLNAVLNSGQLSAGQLSQAQSLLSPLLQNPFVVFGGGATLMAISTPSAGLNLSSTSGQVSSIETALLRADSGQSADLKIGQRYPIINASFSPISLSPAISKVLGNGSFIQPFPSYTYEDLGLDAKMTPHLMGNGEVSLQVDLTVKGLTGVSNNNIPILSNRHLATELSTRNGEPVVMAGLFDREESSTLSGLPGLGQIPGLGRLFSTASGQTTNDQLVLVVTPHVVQRPDAAAAAVWLPAGFAEAKAVTAAPRFERPEFTPQAPRPGNPGGGRGAPRGGGGGG